MMSDLSNDPFVELRQRINEIKKKNINLSKKLKKCELKKYSIENLEMIEKSKVFDETEVSMVEDCYRKALELAEYHLRRKKAKKQQKLNMVHKTKEKGSNKHTASSSYDSNSVKIGTSKPFPTTLWKTENFVGKIESENTNVANYLSSQLGSFINQNIDIPSPHFKNVKEKRKKLKLQSSSSVQDSCFLKPAARKSKPAPVTANCGNQANTKNTFSIIQKIKNNLSPSDMPKSHEVCKKKLSCLNSRVKKSKDTQKQHDCHVKRYVKRFDQNMNEMLDEDIVYLKKVNSNEIMSYNRYIDCSTFCKNSTDKTSTNSQKNSQCPIITLNDTAEEKHFTNKPLNILKEPFRPIVPELDLKQKSTTKTTIEEIYLPEEKGILELDLTEEFDEASIPELDLTEEFAEVAIPDIDLTEEPVEIIVPELDLTEEPVDFPIPKLHMKESVNLLSEELKSKLKSEGVIIKNGKWSNKEKDLLRRNLEDFKSQFGVYNSNLLLGIGRKLHSNKYEYSRVKKFLKAKHFYVRLGKDINERMLEAIYCKARRMFNILKNYSKDCTANDITNIIKLQKIYGNNWMLIGQKLGIDSTDCKNIYLYHKKPIKRGTWSETEIEQLILAIKSVTKVSNIHAEHLTGISWKKVSDLVPTRNQRQCLLEWQNNQSKLFQNALYEKWTESDREKLINLLKNDYPVTDECDILWTEVQKSFRNVIHSEYALKRKWSSIKSYAPKEIKNNFPELIDFLYKKYINNIY